jgi:hypothetical protein
MYSRVSFPAGVRHVRLKQEPCKGFFGDNLACAEHSGWWYVWERATLHVIALFYMAPNTHGWWPAEAHAKALVNLGDPVDIAMLDQIP